MVFELSNSTLFSSTKRIFVKSYEFWSFARHMGIGKNISKNLSSNSQKLLTHAKQSNRDELKTTSKTTEAEGTGNLTVNTIGDKFTKASKISPKYNSETSEEEILKERFIPSELRHEMI